MKRKRKHGGDNRAHGGDHNSTAAAPVSDRAGRVPEGVLRRALDGVRAYEPGKPVEEVQRELGLERVVKLASNEGPFPSVPGRARGDRAGRRAS